MTMYDVKKSNLFNRLRKELGDMVICDDHDHLGSEEAWLGSDYPDWTKILGYCMTDLYVAGLPMDDFPIPSSRHPCLKASFGYDITPKITRSWEEKWEIVKPYWQYIRHSGSGLTTRKALKLFFDCDDLTDETIPKIQKKYTEYLKTGAYKKFLIKEAKFNHVVTVALSLEECPATDILAPLIYSDQYVDIEHRGELYRIENLANQEVYSLKTYLQAVDSILERYKKEGCIGIKWHVMAYLRSNSFDHASYADAEKEFVEILLKPNRGGTGSASSVGFMNMTKFQNYMIHHLIQKTIELDWPIQVHAAQLGLSYGGRNCQSEVKNLTDLFIRYPQARFDMLHCAWPFPRELHAMAHLFPHVYINSSWVELLSPELYKSFFKEFLTSIPLTKFFGCGPDQSDPIMSAAYADRTRDLWAVILEQLISEGTLNEDDAMFAAKQVLLENPTKYFRLDDRIIPKK